MKISKRVGAIILAICMLLSLGLNALGVSAAQSGSITIHKFVGLPLDGAKNNGTEITDGSLNKFTKLDNIKFKITKMLLVDNPTAGVNYFKDAEGNSYIPDATFEPQEKTTANGGIAEFGDLPLGIYYVEEIDGGTTFGIEAFFVSVPTTVETEGGQDYLYNVHVYPKDEQIVIDKEVVDDSVLNDHTVSWKVSSNVPNDIANGTKFVITDKLDERLQYVDGSASIIGEGKASENVLNSYFDVDVDEDNVLTFTLKAGKANFEALKNIDNIYITFDTKVDIDAAGELGDIENKASIDYTNKTGNDFKNESKFVEVTVFGIDILKYGNGDKEDNKLAGAEFYIFANEADALSDDVTKAIKDDEGKDWVVTTDDQGHADIYGLSEGTYYLVETKAPKGYNLLAKPIKVDVYEAQATNYVIDVEVNNVSGFMLPQTGGAGTLWFTFAGLVFIGGAVVIYTVSRKRKA